MLAGDTNVQNRDNFLIFDKNYKYNVKLTLVFYNIDFVYRLGGSVDDVTIYN